MPPPTLAQIAAALYGLGRLARLDGRGLDYFDASPAGLLASFWVAVVLLPLYLLHIGMDLVLLDAGAVVDPARYLAVELIAYVIDWTAFPVVMLALAPFAGFDDRVFRFLVPLNWVQLPIAAVILPLGMMARLGVFPAETVNALGLMIILGSLLITGALARAGLGVSWWAAAGLTLLGLSISLFVNEMAFAMTAGRG